MCVIAGYVGKDRAAPILLEMIKKEEGFFGGYYSGIATISDGKLYYAKVTGDISRLERLTEAAKLPGNIGVIHSRTDFGGNDNWAHPFMSDDGNLAYVANGDKGMFADTTDYVRLVQKLEEEGFEFTSKAVVDWEGYPMLKDKKRVHVSECNAHGITYFIRQGNSPAKAMEKIFCEYPTEIVGLMLHTNSPDRIFVSRVNQPMMLGIGKEECYLASTAMAFPTEREIAEIHMIPENTTCEVYDNRINVIPYIQPPGKVVPITPESWHAAYKSICEKWQENSDYVCTFQELEKIVSDVLPKGIKQTDIIVYEIIRQMLDNEVIKIGKTTTVSPNTGLTAPKFMIQSQKKGKR